MVDIKYVYVCMCLCQVGVPNMVVYLNKCDEVQDEVMCFNIPLRSYFPASSLSSSFLSVLNINRNC